MGVQGDGSRLDSDTSLLLVLSCIGEPPLYLLVCTSCLTESFTYASPAFAAEMIPARCTRESVRVDLPWSTWAMTDILQKTLVRILVAVLSLRLCLLSDVGRPVHQLPDFFYREAVAMLAISSIIERHCLYGGAVSQVLCAPATLWTYLTILAVLIWCLV